MANGVRWSFIRKNAAKTEFFRRFLIVVNYKMNEKEHKYFLSLEVP